VIVTTKKHSNVYYIYKEGGFEPVEKATVCKNNHGLDLFRYRGNVYEGRSGARFITEAELFNLDFKMKSIGGVEVFNKRIEEVIEKSGESPRYTRPDERKKDIFPPYPAKENIVLAKGGDGKKHYYFRFHNEDGVELFTLKNEKEFFHSVFVQCDGHMIAIGSQGNLESIKKRVAEFENGIKGEVERVFNESMENPQKWADLFFAEILGRVDEAKAHNAPIREAREQENGRRDAEREAKRIAEEQAENEKYERAIKTAEHKLLNRQEVINDDVLGDKSLIMQLFREHEIAVPLKTQGWIISSLLSVFYKADREDWSYRYDGNPSTVFWDYFDRLLAAVQTKQQFEEMNQNGGDAPEFDSNIENEDETDMEI